MILSSPSRVCCTGTIATVAVSSVVAAGAGEVGSCILGEGCNQEIAQSGAIGGAALCPFRYCTFVTEK